jgi:IS5 family transposase
MKHGQEAGIVNIVFNKIVGSIQNICTGKRKENLLKKWRAGMEAVISNLKGGLYRPVQLERMETL